MIDRCWLALALCLLLGGCASRHDTESNRTGETFYSPQPVIAGIGGDLFSVHLYRHAEKETGPDPGLTSLGKARARHLAERLSDESVAIRNIWSSPYRRTIQTAQPLADTLDIEIEIYDPRNQPALVKALKSSGGDALVVGHSNTIPELAALLCQCKVEPMTDTEYEVAYVVVLGRGVQELFEVNMRQTWTDRTIAQD